MLELLTGISELLYDVLIYIVLVPKTVLKVFLTPERICAYIDGEFKKKSSERFNDHVQPMVFFLFVAILPYLRLINFSTTYSVPGDFGEILADYKSLGLEIKILAVFLYLIAAPLTPSLVVRWYSGDPTSKDSLRPLLSAQLYIFGVYYLLLCPSLLVIFESFVARQLPGQLLLAVASITGIIDNLWLPYAQIRVIRNQLSVGTEKAIEIMFVCVFVFLVVTTLCESVLVVGFLFGHSRGA